MLKKTSLSLLVLAAIGLFAFMKRPVPKPSSQSPETVLYWNVIAFDAFGGPKYQNSLMASRINAMVHLAIHDALNGIEEKFSRYAFKGKDPKADPIAATASAAHTILINEIPEKKGFLDSALAQSLTQVRDAEAKTRGVKLGIEAAKAVMKKRANDGSKGEVIVPIPLSSQAGVYQAVPPFNIMFAPYWENVQLFSLRSKDQFRVAPYPSLKSEQYTRAFAEVKEYGKANSKARTADQTFYAKYWYEFSEAGWNRVTRTVVENKKLNMLEAARLFALVDMALADAYIAGWDSKIHYNFWRPYTAIRKADLDGNNATLADTTWQPSEPTPPVHDYPSTHSALGNAASTVLAKILGDNTSFSMTSPTAVPANSSRAFKSFSQASDENADSRVKAGIHFRFSCEAGQGLGNKIGEWTVANHLRPLK